MNFIRTWKNFTGLARGLVKIGKPNGISIGGLIFAAVMPCVPSGDANAHVKWFAPYDVTQTPRALFDIMSADFWLLNLAAAAALWSVSAVERTQFGAVLLRSVDHIGVGLRDNTESVFRASVATFFIALWTLGNVIMTPELKTDSEAISWLQAAIAAGMFSRRTMIFSALGIGFLFAFGVANYGPFHMADYPIFLGVAAYLGLRSLGIDFFGTRAIDVARWGAAITLMWASVEKWAFPQWTFPLLDIYEETVEVSEVIAACHRIIHERVQKSRLQLVIDVAENLPALRADQRRLKQIFLNLLSNAVKFTPANGRITLTANRLPNGQIVFSVSDTGIGMKPEDVAIALEPFRQVDGELNRRYEGTGLGLPLVLRLVELHDGHMEIETAPNAGTTVTITLPLTRSVPATTGTMSMQGGA